MNFGVWQTCNFDEQCSPLALHRRRASACFQSRAWPSGRRAGEGNGFAVASLSFLAILYNQSRRRLPRSFPLFSSHRRRSSVELLPSNQRPRHHSKVLNSFAPSLRTHPTGHSRLTSTNFAARRLCSPRPAASPSSVPLRGQCVTVILCCC